MEKLADCYSKLLIRASGDESVSLILLKSLWPLIVGREVARSAHPHKLIDRNLTVLVSESAWEKELGSMTEILIETINRFWATKLVSRVTILRERK